MKYGWQTAGPVELFACPGTSPGPTVVVTAGIHGDEYEGPAAVAALSRLLRPEKLSGAVIAIPIANPPAFAEALRFTPADGKNLARTFPGDPNGSETDRLAAFLWNDIIRHADYLIDLHSGGMEYKFIPVAGFYGQPRNDNRSFAAAQYFGLPHLWQLPPTKGVLSHEAWQHGITAIGMEYLGAGQLALAGMEAYTNGILSCLAHWGLLSDGILPARGSVIYGDWLLAQTDGIFYEYLGLGTKVETGDLIAQICDARGEPLQDFRAPAAGIVAGLRSKAFVRKDSWGVLAGCWEPLP